MRKEGAGSLLITGHGRFLARLTKVELHLLRLAAAEEHLPRIGFLAVPADMVVVSFPLGDRPAPICGEVKPSKGEIMTFAPGHRLHVRTEGPGRWGAIWVPAQDLQGYFKGLTETLRLRSQVMRNCGVLPRRSVGVCCNFMRPRSALPRSGRRPSWTPKQRMAWSSS